MVGPAKLVQRHFENVTDPRVESHYLLAALRQYRSCLCAVLSCPSQVSPSGETQSKVFPRQPSFAGTVEMLGWWCSGHMALATL